MRVVALSSEPQKQADRAKRDWDLDGADFQFVGDPENRLALHLRSEGFLPALEIVGPGSPLENPYGGYAGNKNHPRMSSGKLYPRGCLQPGILIVSPGKEGGDPIALYRWTIASAASNGGGAMGRPLWRHILDAVQRQINKLERGEAVATIEGDVGWGSTMRDLFTCLFKVPFAIYEYYTSEKKAKRS